MDVTFAQSPDLTPSQPQFLDCVRTSGCPWSTCLSRSITPQNCPETTCEKSLTDLLYTEDTFRDSTDHKCLPVSSLQVPLLSIPKLSSTDTTCSDSFPFLVNVVTCLESTSLENPSVLWFLRRLLRSKTVSLFPTRRSQIRDTGGLDVARVGFWWSETEFLVE